MAAASAKAPPKESTNLNEGNFDKFNGYGESLFSEVPYDEDDEAADAVWGEVRPRARRPVRLVCPIVAGAAGGCADG